MDYGFKNLARMGLKWAIMGVNGFLCMLSSNLPVKSIFWVKIILILTILLIKITKRYFFRIFGAKSEAGGI